MKVKDAVTPYDLEQSLLRPQHDPLCAELMSRLLQKKTVRKNENGVEIIKPDNFQTLDYDSWNVMLAKRFSMMHKNYRKFSIKFLGIDPVEQNLNLQSQNDFLPEEEIKQDVVMSQPEQEEQKGDEHTVQVREEFKEQEADQSQIKQQSQVQGKEEQKEEQVLTQVSERLTRSRLAKKVAPISTQNTKVDKNKKGGKAIKSSQSEQASQIVQQVEKEIEIEQLWSSDVRDHILRQHHEQNLTIRFSHESAVGGVGLQNQWKAESLQIIKLFNEDLESQDPFYIEGQDWQQQQKEDQSNYWSNFVDTENIEDFDDYQYQVPTYGKNNQLDVLFKKFHEIPTKFRLDILYFLCQNKLDQEQPDFMQEVLNLQQIKPIKFENEDGLPLKMSEELKLWLEPINMGLLKPLGVITEKLGPLEQNEISVEILPGEYFYFPFFSDTRIYRQSFDYSNFELYLEDYEHIQVFLNLLRQHEDKEECFNFLEKLTKYLDHLKKYADEMKWKEASKVRKLKSQIRSRRLQDLSRKKLQFEGRSSQLQTDFIHHTQGNVMTRRQVDTIKSKITKNGPVQDDGKRREARERGANNAQVKYHEIQKQKQDKERQDRQRRLEKRMRLKERIANGGLGKRSHRGDDSEEEDSYDDEYDDEEVPNSQQDGQILQSTGEKPKKRSKNTEEEKVQLEYDIILNGDLLMIFQRDQEDQTIIKNETMVIKGNWKLSVEEQSEEFIYKKVNSPVQEDLLTELFCEDISEKMRADTNQIKVQNPIQQGIVDKFLECQGLYQGYFKYNEEDVTENFSFILRKPRHHTKKQYCYDICGYGENNIGPFTMEGQLQLFSLDKFQEKDGVKNFIKLKLGKFHLQKQYKKKILEEMVEDVRAERLLKKIMLEQSMAQHQTQIRIQPLQTPERPHKYHNDKPVFNIETHHHSSFQLNTPIKQVPKLPSMSNQITPQIQKTPNHSDQLQQLLSTQLSQIMDPNCLDLQNTDNENKNQIQQSDVQQALFSQVIEQSINPEIVNEKTDQVQKQSDYERDQQNQQQLGQLPNLNAVQNQPINIELPSLIQTLQANTPQMNQFQINQNMDLNQIQQVQMIQQQEELSQTLALENILKRNLNQLNDNQSPSDN